MTKHALFQEESTSKKHGVFTTSETTTLQLRGKRSGAARIARDPAGLGAEGVAHLVR